jgi:glycosyltransferase involved in cell wall biosynthesis
MNANNLKQIEVRSDKRICAIILTYNEGQHLDRCLSSLRGIVSRIVVVDSGSTDTTADIARSHGAEFFVNGWRNYSTQFNWALANANLTEAWCLRIDADEYLSEPLRESLRRRVLEADVPDYLTGFYVNRIMVFMGRAIRHGGCGKLYMLRLFRPHQGRCEERWMDEHIALKSGRTERLTGELVDENLNNIGWWIGKHNNYATREAIDLLNIRHGFEEYTSRVSIQEGSQASRKRWLKEMVYARLPTGLRAALYFAWRYLGQAGFLDGRAGLVFHFMQGFWYRLLVDVKVNELEHRAATRMQSIEQVIEAEYGFRVGSYRS